MKRRDFLKLVGAAVLYPSLPKTKKRRRICKWPPEEFPVYWEMKMKFIAQNRRRHGYFLDEFAHVSEGDAVFYKGMKLEFDKELKC